MFDLYEYLICNHIYSRATARQAVCLDDLPSTVQRSKNAYLKDGKKPGELINAYEQCQEAFGAGFRPHVKRESPFEVRNDMP